MRTVLLALALLTACGVEEPTSAGMPSAPAELPEAQVPPPVFTLSAPGTAVPGASFTVSISGTLGEDERAYLIVGTRGVGAGPCPLPLGGLCIDMLAPAVVGSTLIDASGNASITITVPPTAPIGATVGLQAVVVRGLGATASVKSNTATATVQAVVSGTQTFGFSGAAESFTVPSGVTALTVAARGAQGGSDGNPGGAGGEAMATVPVTPGEVLQVNVGGQGACDGNLGAGGFNGGGDAVNAFGAAVSCGGGGATDVRRAPYGLGDRLVVGAGGGGGGTAAESSPLGGAGGGLVGDPGIALNPFNTNIQPGPGGTQTAGGVAFVCCGGGYPNESGSLGLGGDCYHDASGCGAGGGGFFGGAGGSFAGGGGGSSFISAPGSTGASTTAGVQGGHGTLTLSW